MNASESNNRRRLDDTHRAGRGAGEAAFGARQMMSAMSRATIERKKIEVASLNALLTNKILAALPAEDFKRLLPHLAPVTLNAGQDLFRFEEGVRFAYFPETAVVSHLYVLTDGTTTEASMIGREGVAGLSAILGARQPCYWTRILVAGTALKIRMDILKHEFGRSSALQKAVLAYAGARLAQLSQRAVCSSCHKVKERLCCWLLMVHDRAGDDQFQLTQELIAGHLGVRRAGITENANALRDRNIISYNRGLLRILDRRRLEAAACECYQMLGQPAARML